MQLDDAVLLEHQGAAVDGRLESFRKLHCWRRVSEIRSHHLPISMTE